MPAIAPADRQAMNSLFQTVVATGAKQAGVVDKDLPMNTEEAFKDHESYVKTLESVLADDKSTSFEPNDPILD